jgi:hypothetical protein
MGARGERRAGDARGFSEVTWVLSLEAPEAPLRDRARRDGDGCVVRSEADAPIGSHLRIRGASLCPSANPSARCRCTCTRRPLRCSVRKAVICSGSGSTHPLAARTSARKRTPIPPRRRAVTETSLQTSARIGTSPERNPRPALRSARRSDVGRYTEEVLVRVLHMLLLSFFSPPFLPTAWALLTTVFSFPIFFDSPHVMHVAIPIIPINLETLCADAV